MFNKCDIRSVLKTSKHILLFPSEQFCDSSKIKNNETLFGSWNVWEKVQGKRIEGKLKDTKNDEKNLILKLIKFPIILKHIFILYIKNEEFI